MLIGVEPHKAAHALAANGLGAAWSPDGVIIKNLKIVAFYPFATDTRSSAKREYRRRLSPSSVRRLGCLVAGRRRSTRLGS